MSSSSSAIKATSTALGHSQDQTQTEIGSREMEENQQEFVGEFWLSKGEEITAETFPAPRGLVLPSGSSFLRTHIGYSLTTSSVLTTTAASSLSLSIA